MTVQHFVPIALLALAPMLTTAAAAQEAPSPDTSQGWDIVEADNAISATVAYSTGVAVVVRCLVGREFQVLLAGLPAPGRDEFLRTLEVTGPGGELASSSWVVATDPTIAFALAPSRTARALRTGQPFTVRAPTAEGRHMRYELDLPAGSDAVDRVLLACDRPLEDPSDLDVVVDPRVSGVARIDWAQRPEPHYPSRAESGRVTQGVAALDCAVLESGRLTGCRIEAELPAGMGFGPAAVQAAHAARLTRAGSESARGRARFHIRFRLR